MIIKTVFTIWLHPISAPQAFALNVLAIFVNLSKEVVLHALTIFALILLVLGGIPSFVVDANAVLIGIR